MEFLLLLLLLLLMTLQLMCVLRFGTLYLVVKVGSYLEFLLKFVLKVYSSKALAPALVLGLESCKDSTTSVIIGALKTHCISKIYCYGIVVKLLKVYSKFFLA